MYNIAKIDEYLLVEFMDDFDFSMIQTAIYHETSMCDYPDTNDIWLIGENRTKLCLSEIDLMVKDFQCRCPRDASRTKTAIVVSAGLTGSIIELFVHSLKKRLDFEIEIFRTLDAAEDWLRISESGVA